MGFLGIYVFFIDRRYKRIFLVFSWDMFGFCERRVSWGLVFEGVSVGGSRFFFRRCVCVVCSFVGFWGWRSRLVFSFLEFWLNFFLSGI